ncbi:MAG: molybdopterin molybdotransferase MoeA [Prolixibacteraceae bacterium]|jgi:molybdopterin molybdotransferase|nr:molybdopterin molybdotransferase MoeA [Prolixibacteraceae bacterium]
MEFSKAIKKIRQHAEPIGKETVLLADSLNRVLAVDVVSDINIPPFNKAAMDGFACKRADLPGPFKIVEDIPAGKFSDKTINKGECARIMTGAALPKGADTVFMVEYHEIQTDGTVTFTRANTSDNICLIGEDVKEGVVVLKGGSLIGAAEIAILSGVGKSNVEVYRRPKVAVLSTGSELVEPYVIPKPGQIRNSNGNQMIAQLTEMGMIAEYFGIVADTKEEIRGKILSVAKLTDVIFISGGVSVGDYDYVPQVLMELDYDILFTSIATKPGKHTLFAQKDNKYVLGFPGNPVSSFVQLNFIGKELLYGLMNHQPMVKTFKCVFIDDFKRKKADRLEFLPVNITKSGKVKLLPYNGSAHILALTVANALMEIPIGVKTIEKGDLVNVRPL